MDNIKFQYTDRRQEFSSRFHQIASTRGIDINTHTPLLRDDQSTFELTSNTSPYNVQPTDRVTLIVPGLLGNSLRALIAPLLCARERLTVDGYHLKVVWVSGRSGCNHNAMKLREQVLRAANSSGQAVNVIGYSKGCADAIHMLGNHQDTHESVASLVSYAGVALGTPLADSVPHWLNTLLRYFPLPGESFGDGLAINDLTYARRHQWLIDNPLPSNVRYASISASPKPEQVSRILKSSYQKLAKIHPDNDSQVIARDAIIPYSELLAITNADHWAIALPIAEKHNLLSKLIVNKNAFPRDVLLQAVIDHLSNTQPLSTGPVNKALSLVAD